MTLAQRIANGKESLVDRWYDLVLATYPGETAKLWRRNNDPFTNPVGQTTHRALAELVDHLLVWNDAQAICKSLDEVVKIRAVQDFTPAKAMAFIFLLKKALREVFSKDLAGGGLDAELADLDARVDNMALMGFDVYVREREKIFRMRVDEFKRTHRMIFRKTGIMCETTDSLVRGGPDEAADADEDLGIKKPQAR